MAERYSMSVRGKCAIISNLQLRSGNQQHDVPALVIGEGGHCFLSVLYILAINLRMTHTNIINSLLSQTQGIKHVLFTQLNIFEHRHKHTHTEANFFLSNTKALKKNKVPQ